jgi:signal transduction histidine kinase
MYNGCLIFFSLFIASNLFAQKSDLNTQLEKIDKSNAHETNITELKSMLTVSNLTNAESIAVQTALIHQYQELHQWDTCLHYCQSQIALAQKQNNKLAEATFYRLLGNTFYHISDKEKAVVYWEKAIAISEPNKYYILLEQCYHNIGSVILESGKNYDEAEKNFQKAIRLSIANKTDTTELGNLHYRLLATLYQVTGRLEKADVLYTAVIRQARKLNDSLRIAEALMFYAELLSNEKKYDRAVEKSKEALLISQKFNKLDMEQTALSSLSSSYAQSGNFKEAYRYLYANNQSVRKRFNTDLNSKMSEAEAKFNTSELQHENEIASIKAKKEKQIYITGFAGLLILASFAFYYFYQKRSIKQKVQIQSQVQEEKERLSRDLHDNLGSQMALLSNNVESLDINYRKHLGINGNIDQIKSTSKQLLQTLRETIWILNKEQVSGEDFFDKLVDYAHRFLQSYPGIQLRVEENFTGDRQLNSNEALQLFRICQEAITNSCKYAGSDVLELHGKTELGIFTICIEDSGKGFDSKALHEEGHYGLKNMQKRATSINADLQIIAKKGDGVTISIHV